MDTNRVGGGAGRMSQSVRAKSASGARSKQSDKARKDKPVARAKAQSDQKPKKRSTPSNGSGPRKPRASRAIADDFFVLSTEMLAVTDCERFHRVNQAICEGLGLSERELLSTPISSLVHPEDLARMQAEHASQNSGTIKCRCRFRHSSGSWRMLEWNARIQDGLRYAAARDITDIVEHERAIEQTTSRLSEAMRIGRMGAWVYNPLTSEVTWSDETYRLFGFNPGERKVDFEFFRSLVLPEYHETVSAALDGIISGRTDKAEYIYQARRKDGQIVWLRVRAEARLDHKKRLELIRGITQDITAEIHSNENLRKTHTVLEKIFSTGPELIAYMDRDFNFIRVNPQYAEADSREPDFYPGKNHFALFPDADNEAIFRRVVATGEPYHAYSKPFEYADKPERGVTYWNWTLTPVKDHMGEVESVLLVLADVTGKVRVREALERERDRNRRIIETANVMFVALDENGCVLNVNRATVEITGYSREELAGKPWFELVAPRSRYPHVWKAFERIRSESDKCPEHFENPILTKFGEERIISWSNSFLKEPDGFFSISFGLDVTRQRAADAEIKQSTERLAEAQRIGKIGSFEFDLTANREIWSDEYYNLLGLDPSTPARFEKVVEHVHPEDRERFVRTARHCMKNGVPSVVSYRILRNGEVRYHQARAEVQRGTDGAPAIVRGTVQDITEAHMAEEILKASLREKEILLGEVHHRVKNNLNIIVSLLGLQSRGLENPAIRRELTEAQNRVRAMARVHEMLYQNSDMGRIDVKDYLTSLAVGLFHTYNISPSDISLSIHAGPVALGLDDLIPCGLMLNELITNALKHAFPSGGRGIVSVECREEGSHAVLAVEDSGKGMTDSIIIEEARTLGFVIVQALARQLSGEASVSRAARSRSGTRVEIRFPLNAA